MGNEGYRGKARFALIRVLLILGLAGISAGCQKEDGQASLDAAVALCKQWKWRAAQAPLKKYLVDHPGDIRAHFWLGRCFLLEAPETAAAEGEFKTALKLFKENGGHSPIEGYSDEYFELRCHLEIAKNYSFRIEEMAMRHLDLVEAQSLLKKLRNTLDEAERIAPESPDMEWLRDLLKKSERIVDRLRRYVSRGTSITI